MCANSKIPFVTGTKRGDPELRFLFLASSRRSTDTMSDRAALELVEGEPGLGSSAGDPKTCPVPRRTCLACKRRE